MVNSTITAGVDGMQAIVSGRTTANDGGGGVFVYSAASALSTNLGTIFKPALANGRWIRQFEGLINVKWFGATGDGATDDTAAIQSAVDVASGTGIDVYVPSTASNYRIVPTITRTNAAGVVTVGVLMRSNMHITADPGAAIRLANNQSTDAAPKRISMFSSIEALTNISFLNLTIDMNGLNNLISSNRPTTYNITFNQAHIEFSGDAARGTDVSIIGCRLINTAGTSCIVMGQSGTPAIALGKRWLVQDCLFNNNGNDTTDHSSIYGWAEDVVCSGNTFTADTMVTVAGVGTLVAFEVHGARQSFIGNIVRNYYRGVWVAPNLTSAVDNINVTGNTFSPLRGRGVDFDRAEAASTVISNVIIQANSFVFGDDLIDVGGQKAAILMLSPYAITDVLISGNYAAKLGTTNVNSVFASIGAISTQVSKHNRIVISDNQTYGFAGGVALTSESAIGLGRISVHNNIFHDNISAGSAEPVGINVNFTSGSMERLDLVGNNIDTAAYGISITGVITNLSSRVNVFQNMGATNYLFNTAQTQLNPNQSVRFDSDNANVLNSTYYATNSVGGSGTYTPTLVNVANLDGSGTFTAQWSRSGNVVTVSGKVTVDPTTTLTLTQLGMSLPIASAITAQEQVGGTSFASGIAGQGAAIRGDATNDRAEMVWIAADVTNQPMYFQFSYLVQ